MKQKEWTTLDRTRWGPGEWDAEPDKVQWFDERVGLPMLAVRHPELGHWCGYVGVAPGHPLHGAKYQDVDENFDVHGGITFSGKCQPGGGENHGICHVPEPGEPDDVWWFGFDCCHFNDLSPGLEATMREVEARTRSSLGFKLGVPHPGFTKWYKPLVYVKVECYRLGRQLVMYHVDGVDDAG